VGNLACPALFDLGERAKVVVMSVTEGEDKPSKYPHAFRAAELCVLTKVDLVPYLEFDVAKFLEHVHDVHPALPVVQTSAEWSASIEPFAAWIRERLAEEAS
jgi:hydrogenase nickel incorporation protein HypB